MTKQKRFRWLTIAASLGAAVSAVSMTSAAPLRLADTSPPAPAGQSAQAVPTAANAVATVPFHYVNNKVVIDVRINGAGPYSFAVDSGSETMIVSASTARACHLPIISANVEVSGTTGSFVPSSIAEIAKLQIGSAAVQDPVCTVAANPISFDGYIGAPLFNVYTVQMDFGKQMLSLYEKGKYVADPADDPVPIIFGAHRVPVAVGTIGGLNAKFEIDTGSAFNIELLPAFVKSNDLTAKFQKLGTTMTSSVTGPARADVYDLKSLDLGANNPINIPGAIQTVFLPSSPPTATFDGRIGAPMLSRQIVTFDYAHSKMYLRPIPPPEGISL